MTPDGMRMLVAALPAETPRRTTWQRTTTYDKAHDERARAADNAPELLPI